MEYLSPQRAGIFVTYALEHDLQVRVQRNTALQLLNRSLARDEDENVLAWSAESFDKMQTFLSQNDVQVHYATAANTVGVYAIVRLLGELRRALRDHSPSALVTFGEMAFSPIHRPERQVAGLGSPSPAQRQLFRDAEGETP